MPTWSTRTRLLAASIAFRYATSSSCSVKVAPPLLLERRQVVLRADQRLGRAVDGRRPLARQRRAMTARTRQR